jgi:hypothetical protein
VGRNIVETIVARLVLWWPASSSSTPSPSPTARADGYEISARFGRIDG